MTDWICSYGVVNCLECRRDGKPLIAASADDRIYFRIPYADRESAKSFGCRWDPDRRLWYAYMRNVKLSEIGKRWPSVATQPAAQPPKPITSKRSEVRMQPPGAVPARSTQLPLPDLMATPVTEPYVPPPGSVPWDDFMSAIRAADEADTPKPQQVSDVVPVRARKEAK